MMKIVEGVKNGRVTRRVRSTLGRTRRRAAREPEYTGIVVVGALMVVVGATLMGVGLLVAGLVLVEGSLMVPLVAIYFRARCAERRLLESCTTIVEGSIEDYAHRGTDDIETWMRQSH
jgi:hypothetical protein